MTSFSLLPKYVLILFLKDWILLKDVCHIDTALCNTQQRPKFLTHIILTKFHETWMCEKCTFEYLLWLYERHLLVKQLNVTINFVTSSIIAKTTNRPQFWSLARYFRCKSNVNAAIEHDAKSSSSAMYFNHLAIALEALDISSSLTLRGSALLDIVSLFFRLKTVNFAECVQVTDKVVVLLAKNCTSLTELNLKKCRLVSNVGVKAVSHNCPNLTRLNLFNCVRVSDASLIALGVGCPGLVRLNIGTNEKHDGRDKARITDSGLVALCQRCRGLSHLSVLRRHMLTHKSVNALSHCTQLTNLNLSLRDGALPDDVSALVNLFTAATQLQKLNLSALKNLPAVVLTAIGTNCTNLTSLSLAYQRRIISESSLILIATRCVMLEALSLLAFEFIYDATIIAFAVNCTNLTDLSLVQCSALTDTSINSVAFNCRRLTSLVLQGSDRVTEVALLNFVMLSYMGLKRLDLRSSVVVSDKLVIAAARHCAVLTELHLSYSPLVTDESLIEVATYCVKLTVLCIEFCDKITHSGVVSVAEKCLELHTLHMAFCAKIGHQAITQLAVLMNKRLMHLDIRGISLSSNACLEALGRHCSNLSTVMVDCPTVTDEGVRALVTGCRRLRKVSVNGSTRLSDSAVHFVALNCHMLTHLDISSCSRLTGRSVDVFATHCPTLSHLAVHRFHNLKEMISQHAVDALQLARPTLSIDLY